MDLYKPKHKIRFVTAASLFDGHDAAINIIRRLLQLGGAEVIHLGHNRSVEEIVEAALQEDVQGIAISSYQGGHVEFFRYMVDMLKDRGADHIQVFGGGGGTIVAEEIVALQDHGVRRIYSPEDGRQMGLEGIISDMLEAADFPTVAPPAMDNGLMEAPPDDHRSLARLITVTELNGAMPDDMSSRYREVMNGWSEKYSGTHVIGITGTGGAGKSSLTDELVGRLMRDFPDLKVAVLCVDPSKKKTGGALLGDRIRMNSVHQSGVYMRSLATRGSTSELSASIDDAVLATRAAGHDVILVETSGIGQGDAAIVGKVDHSIYVMTPEYGAPSQLEKIDMIDFADMIVINKFDRGHAEDSLRDVRKQFRRSREMFGGVDDGDLPVFGTISSQYNDPGVNALYHHLVSILEGLERDVSLVPEAGERFSCLRNRIIPPDRVGYLGEAVRSIRGERKRIEDACEQVHALESVEKAVSLLEEGDARGELEGIRDRIRSGIDGEFLKSLADWEETRAQYSQDQAGDKVADPKQAHMSLSGTRISRIALPRFRSQADLLRWIWEENLPGFYPFTAGVFPFKREDEEPARMFAGEGTPERTNVRFHLLCENEKAKRLSTAFDSVTLYGQDPDVRPDIYGKIGESGVSVCSLGDMEKLFHGFDLASQNTSVSMTINGPAPIILAMFLNAAFNQALERFASENEREPNPGEQATICADVLKVVRGTVQADILKEDQAQNTCIFSTEFALRMMGDIQEFFISNEVRNYYSVSISGYHIAEAGANPVTQLAFTLANGLTYVEYYLARGMKVDDFARNLSFFFSNGLDPEYSVLGRVARRIWARTIRNCYGGSSRSQKLKYHVQTSGRSLHAQEIDFNDIRTTLQALIAFYDNCNSLHTNAYDEAITTPTEDSVRRALAIQLIINREFGMSKNENPLQGSFIMEELTDLVEEAVLCEFEAIDRRGGVIGAMEAQYQRAKIQEESMLYEHKKHSGDIPIVGVNTFLRDTTDEEMIPRVDLTRASMEEKNAQIENLGSFQMGHSDATEAALEKLRSVALGDGNVFAELMETVKVASLGQITTALYEVGGRYRRNM